MSFAFQKMEGFSFVTPVTGLNSPNTGKEDDDDASNINSFIHSVLQIMPIIFTCDIGGSCRSNWSFSTRSGKSPA
jgi:hypothetical protein